MLAKDRKERIGAKGDIEEILSHPWFQSIDIQKIMKRKIKAPFIPEVDSKTDLRNFDPEVLGEGLSESIVPEEGIEMIKNKQLAFQNFGPLISNEVSIPSLSGKDKKWNKNQN